ICESNSQSMSTCESTLTAQEKQQWKSQTISTLQIGRPAASSPRESKSQYMSTCESNLSAQAEVDSGLDSGLESSSGLNPPTPLNSNSAGSEHREDLKTGVSGTPRPTLKFRI